jgi:hypothetical protein
MLSLVSIAASPTTAPCRFPGVGFALLAYCQYNRSEIASRQKTTSTLRQT